MKQVIALSIICVSVCAAWAQTAPKLLPFQGRLTDQNGMAVSNGVRLVQFKIYDVPIGGSPIWSGEIHRTTVNGGLVNVMLGSKTPFTGLDFNQQLYLEITVDINGDNTITAADPPMLPRQAILPVVFAKEAADSRLLDGYDWNAVFAEGAANPSSAKISGNRIVNQSITTAQLASASVTSSQLAPGAVTASAIANNAIGTAQIANGAIGLQHISQAAANVLVPPGTLIAYAGDTVPAGWLACDGQAVSRATYSNLWASIGRVWGVGDGSTTFNVPDLRGLFLRGLDGTAGRDPDKASRTQLAPGGNSGNQVGSLQTDELKSHNHSISGYTYLGGGAQNGSFPGGLAFPLTGIISSSAGGAETRSKNIYVLYIIKY